MKKSFIFLISVLWVWNIFGENIYYIEKNGTILNLGKNEEAYFDKDRRVLINGEKYYKDGKENKAEGEKIKQSILKSTGYIMVEKITDEVWVSTNNSYVIRSFDPDDPFQILTDLKIFGGLNEVIFPDKYFGYLVIKDNKVYYPDDVTSLGDEARLNTGNIDLSSLEQIENNYFKDKNGIYTFDLDYYYQYESEGKNPDRGSFKKIKNADIKSFQVLSENYAKDEKNVYYKDKVIKVKDTDGFQILKLWNTEPSVFIIGYSRDGIYFDGKKISGIALEGKAEAAGQTIFKDNKQMYIFREYENSKMVIEKRNIPVTARYTGWIFDDDKYLYDPYLDDRIPKTKDFEWMDKGNLFRNNGKIYLISPMFGIMEQEYDSDTFRLVYKDNFTKIASDKNGYYIYSGDSTGWRFQKTDDEKIKLLNNTENIMEKVFYNPEHKKYYFLLNPYMGEVIELTGIKQVSKVQGEYYITGE